MASAFSDALTEQRGDSQAANGAGTPEGDNDMSLLPPPHSRSLRICTHQHKEGVPPRLGKTFHSCPSPSNMEVFLSSVFCSLY